jgi:uncharacterized DUF497 family protein
MHRKWRAALANPGLGLTDLVLLRVAHTWREAEHGAEHIRIISARRATKLERKIYEQDT